MKNACHSYGSVHEARNGLFRIAFGVVMIFFFLQLLLISGTNAYLSARADVSGITFSAGSRMPSSGKPAVFSPPDGESSETDAVSVGMTKKDVDAVGNGHDGTTEK